jgi:hypothetical protein
LDDLIKKSTGNNKNIRPARGFLSAAKRGLSA